MANNSTKTAKCSGKTPRIRTAGDMLKSEFFGMWKNRKVKIVQTPKGKVIKVEGRH